MNVGRPKKITETVIGKLREAFLWGCTDKEACLYAGINPDTLYEYQKNHPEYSDEKEAYKCNPILIARKTVVEAIKTDPDLAFKYLERKRADEFSIKQTANQTPDDQQFGGFIIVRDSNPQQVNKS